ncbi:biotin transporter BioY [Bhargavaea cecembensis]|uniref:biotin transporter BioY n=1 Tax=Bhargavaea cecembensis TaxID=394098 RepID=UPI000591842D|nr:biotin transporter BioY [Bhargavaea cecembensis]
MGNERLKMMILAALFAALMGVGAQIIIPVPPVPFTAQTLVLPLMAIILGKRYGTLAAVLYVLLGTIGIPVFAGMKAGLGIIFGPTGGFILSYIPAAFLIGWIFEKGGGRTAAAVAATVVGAMFILLAGTVWLKYMGSLPWSGAFAGGMLPFIIPDLIKAGFAAVVGVLVRNRLASARLLPAALR